MLEYLEKKDVLFLFLTHKYHRQHELNKGQQLVKPVINRTFILPRCKRYLQRDSTQLSLTEFHSQHFGRAGAPEDNYQSAMTEHATM